MADGAFNPGLTGFLIGVLHITISRIGFIMQSIISLGALNQRDPLCPLVFWIGGKVLSDNEMTIIYSDAL